jgi:hypothetical protein
MCGAITVAMVTLLNVFEPCKIIFMIHLLLIIFPSFLAVIYYFSVIDVMD